MSRRTSAFVVTRLSDGNGTLREFSNVFISFIVTSFREKLSVATPFRLSGLRYSCRHFVLYSSVLYARHANTCRADYTLSSRTGEVAAAARRNLRESSVQAARKKNDVLPCMTELSGVSLVVLEAGHRSGRRLEGSSEVLIINVAGGGTWM